MTMTLLTSREQEIASLASTGLSNKGIARRLELSEGTVKVHLHNIFQKTGVSNRTALVALMLPYSRHELGVSMGNHAWTPENL
jgi:two-component system nitrate/nitrite response regulator NarL